MSIINSPEAIRCPSCNELIASRILACDKCGYQLIGGTPARLRVIAQRTLIPVTAHLHYLVDTTGSTAVRSGNITKFTQSSQKIVGSKAAKLLTSVYSCGDLEPGGGEAPKPTVALAEGVSPAQSEAVLKSLIYEGGGDAEETHLDSIEAVLNWIPPGERAERHSLIAFFTDASKPMRSGMTPQELGARARAQGVFPVLVCQPCPLLESFREASGGLMYPITRDPSDDEITEVASKVAVSVLASLTAGRKTIPSAIN